MADAYGGVVNNWRCHLNYVIVQQDDAKALVRSTVYFQAVANWQFNGLAGNFGATVAGQTASASTGGGISVGPNGQQNIAAKEVWITKGRSAQNVSCSGYININGYAAGSSSANGTISIGAKPSHTVSYNANGGSGAPGNQVKWYGEVLILSSTKPTRPNYEFQGWAKSASGPVEYQPGSKYGLDQNITFYAIWKQSFVPPTIADLSVDRCDASGNITNRGTYAKVSCSWSTSDTNDSSNQGQSLVVKITPTGGEASTDSNTISGKSGTFSKVYPGISESSSYTVEVKVADKHLSSIVSKSLPKSTYILDIRANGRGLGIGTTSSADDRLNIGWKTEFEQEAIMTQRLNVQDGLNFMGSSTGGLVTGIHFGSKVITPGSTRCCFIPQSELEANYGGYHTGDILIPVNGDYRANQLNIVSVDYTPDGWNINLDASKGGVHAPMRVNFALLQTRL